MVRFLILAGLCIAAVPHKVSGNDKLPSKITGFVAATSRGVTIEVDLRPKDNGNSTTIQISQTWKLVFADKADELKAVNDLRRLQILSVVRSAEAVGEQVIDKDYQYKMLVKKGGFKILPL